MESSSSQSNVFRKTYSKLPPDKELTPDIHEDLKQGITIIKGSSTASLCLHTGPKSQQEKQKQNPSFFGDEEEKLTCITHRKHS